MNSDECERIRDNVENLIEEIEDELDDDEPKSNDEIYELQKIKKEAIAIEEYISVIILGNNGFLDIDNLRLANDRINGAISYVTNGKYCINIVCIKINGFKSYLFYNPSNENLTGYYKYKANNYNGIGKGYMGIMKYSMRSIFNNRDREIHKDIFFYDIKCENINMN